MVVRDHPALGLSRQCRLLSVGRSSLYYEPKGESAETLALMRRIDELFLKYPFYGARWMALHLRREGVGIGRRRAGRLMRLMGLQAIYRAPRTSDPHPEHRVWPYLLRGLTIERANHVWCADITYKGRALGSADAVEERLADSRLTRGQKEAVRTVLLSDDLVVGVQGHAGSGNAKGTWRLYRQEGLQVRRRKRRRLLRRGAWAWVGPDDQRRPRRFPAFRSRR